MVAYNFQKQFAPPIRERLKTHTIRRNGKRKHAEPGQMLQIYTGMRTSSCAKIIDDVQCIHSLPISIGISDNEIEAIWIQEAGNQIQILDLKRFAIDDGFSGVNSFHEFWIGFHGVGLFQGRLISWGDFSTARYREAAS